MSTPPEMERRPLLGRREAVRRLTALLGGAAFIGGEGLLIAAEKLSSPVRQTTGAFSAADVGLLDEIAETILPATTTPGAKEAKVGAFMALMVTDCYSPAQQRIFREGLRKVDAVTRTTHKVGFMEASADQRLAILTALDREQKSFMDGQKENADAPAHYFRMMKQLALLGYFTSEIGCTQAQRYVETPGRFDPCVPYAAGEPAWASHA